MATVVNDEHRLCFQMAFARIKSLLPLILERNIFDSDVLCEMAQQATAPSLTSGTL